MSIIFGPSSKAHCHRLSIHSSTTTSDTDSNQDYSDIEDLELPKHYPLICSTTPRKQVQSASFSLTLRLYLIMSLLLFTLLFAIISALIDQSPASYNEELGQTNWSPQSTASSIPFVRAFHLSLDPASDYRLFWTVDYDDESVLFEIRFKQRSSLDWIAIGFSDYGSVSEADLCLLWFDKRAKLHFDDIKTDNQSFVLLDQQSNDCRFIRARRKGRTIRFSYRRSFDTCDPDDYAIDDGTTHVVYATGQGPLSRVEGLRLSDHRHGLQRTRLLKPMKELSKLPSSTGLFAATNRNATIPVQETVYWCRLLKLPPNFVNKTHVIQYEANIQNENEGQVHHMEVFHCEVDHTVELPAWDGECLDPTMPTILKACKRVVAAWAFGAGPLTYPAHVGLPVGGANYSQYVMLEVHFNNPERRPLHPDNSGILLYYSDKLRPIDAGILEVGLEYSAKNSIPPGMLMLQQGYCVSECTRAALPPYGITVFASQLHTHLTGVSVWTRHVRGGIELPELNRDQHYSQHFQEIRELKRPVTVFPGDALINVCRYDTRQRDRVTLGGLSISDEMCVNYMHYYPKTNLEVCKSSIDSEQLSRYFEYMARQEGQNTSRVYSVEDNFRNIHWNGARAATLDRLYQTAPLSVQCNKSSGDRFPGYWNGIPLTQILRPLKPTANPKCRLSMSKTDLEQGFEFRERTLDPEIEMDTIDQLGQLEHPLTQHNPNHHNHHDMELHMQNRNIFDSSQSDSNNIIIATAPPGMHSSKHQHHLLETKGNNQQGEKQNREKKYRNPFEWKRGRGSSSSEPDTRTSEHLGNREYPKNTDDRFEM